MNSSSSPSYSSTNASVPSRCAEAEHTLNNLPLSFVRLLQISLAIPTFAAALVLFRLYRKEQLNFHANLTLLIMNIVLFCSVHSLAIFVVCMRYEMIKLTYTDPCEFLTPVWLVFLTRVPSYAYFFAQPLLHLAIMAERLRATLFANRYEREGIGCGIASASIVWLLTICYMTFVCLTDLRDRETFGQPMVIATLTSRYNSSIILFTYFLALAIILVTIVGDYVITVMNRRMQANRPLTNAYNLSENFQIRENIVAMRLILPIDVIYGLMYSLYMVGAVFVRSLYAEGRLNTIDYSFYYDLLNSFLFLYITISFLVYIYFIKFMIKSRRKLASVGPSQEEGEVYFRQLNSQWGAAS